MYRNFNSADSQLDKVMTNEQFEQIVEAILSGKYSWACLLILKFSGYNPLHYIPYRTYNRLLKNNRHGRSQSHQPTASHRSSAVIKSQPKNSNQLPDLYYLEEIDDQATKVEGGTRICSSEITANFVSPSRRIWC